MIEPMLGKLLEQLESILFSKILEGVPRGVRMRISTTGAREHLQRRPSKIK